jgi:hypothetical protein
MGDFCLCLVLVVSDCQGGSLCFYEPGLVLDLKNGDIVLFKSDCLSHFNLYFKEIRASLVFHSDKASGALVSNRNGWKDHSDLRSTDIPTA